MLRYMICYNLLQMHVKAYNIYPWQCRISRYMNIIKVVAPSFKHEIKTNAKTSLVPNAWANQMSLKFTSVPDCVFVPTNRACSLISSLKDIAATLRFIGIWYSHCTVLILFYFLCFSFEHSFTEEMVRGDSLYKDSSFSFPFVAQSQKSKLT